MSKQVIKDLLAEGEVLGKSSGVLASLPNSGGSGAPTNADYLVKTANGSLSAERVVTDTASVVWNWGTAGQAKADVQFGTTSTTACVGNDSRLSDARTPLTHTHAPADVTGTAVITSDARLSDARTPTAHTHPQSEVTSLTTDLAARLTQAQSLVRVSYRF